jgi:hypothetical protein
MDAIDPPGRGHEEALDARAEAWAQRIRGTEPSFKKHGRPRMAAMQAGRYLGDLRSSSWTLRHRAAEYDVASSKFFRHEIFPYAIHVENIGPGGPVVRVK